MLVYHLRLVDNCYELEITKKQKAIGTHLNGFAFGFVLRPVEFLTPPFVWVAVLHPLALATSENLLFLPTTACAGRRGLEAPSLIFCFDKTLESRYSCR